MLSHKQENSCKINIDFSQEIVEARRQWDDIFKVLKKKKSTKNLHPAKLSFKNEGEVKTFPDQ